MKFTLLGGRIRAAAGPGILGHHVNKSVPLSPEAGRTISTPAINPMKPRPASHTGVARKSNFSIMGMPPRKG